MAYIKLLLIIMAEAGDCPTKFIEVPLESNEGRQILGRINAPFWILITGICAVIDPVASKMFYSACDYLEQKKKVELNIVDGFHCSKANLMDVCSSGLNCREGGFLGAGIYFGVFEKANDYFTDKFQMNGRTILMCSVALGNCKQFELGNYDRNFHINRNREQFDSARTFIRNGVEFCIYNPYHQNAEYIITYNIVSDVVPKIPPPSVSGNVIYMLPQNLSVFFSDIKSRSTPAIMPNVKSCINRLLRKEIDPAKFICEIETLFGARSPPSLLANLTAELDKVKPNPTQPVAQPSQPVLPVAQPVLPALPILPVFPVALPVLPVLPARLAPSQSFHSGRTSLACSLEQAHFVLREAPPSQLVRMESVAGDSPFVQTDWSLPAPSCRPPKRGESEAQADSDEEERPSKRGLRRM